MEGSWKRFRGLENLVVVDTKPIVGRGLASWVVLATVRCGVTTLATKSLMYQHLCITKNYALRRY